MSRLDETPVRHRSGVITPEPSPGTPPGQQRGESRITKFVPTWLARVLGLASAPSSVRIDRVLPVLDVYERGYGVAIAKHIHLLQPSNQPLTIIRVIDTPYGVIRTLDAASGAHLPIEVFGASVQMVARIIGGTLVASLAAAGNVLFTVLPSNVPLGSASGWYLRNRVLPIGNTTDDTVALFGSAPERVLVVPPGFALDIALPATGGADTVTLDLGVLLAPAGFSL